VNSLFAPVVNLWSEMRRGNIPLPEVVPIERDRCLPRGSAGSIIRRNQMYFTIWLTEMHLTQNRQWWSEFDPLVVIVVEFNYGNERVAIPKVIGPSLIATKKVGDKPLHGSVLLDTKVTGPHPYRGDDVAISVALYQVERVNHAGVLLSLVESLSAALGGPSDMAAIGKTGEVVLRGIEGLLGLGGTKLLAGARMSLATSIVNPLTSGFTAIVAPPIPPVSQLCVADRRLRIGANEESGPYQSSDFVLIGVGGSEAREDENVLPFFPMKAEALAAIFEGESGIKRGKATLIAAYQQMLKSPDLTANGAGSLFDGWVKEFEGEKERLKRVRVLSQGGTDEAVRMRRSTHGGGAQVLKDLDKAMGRLDF